MSLIFESYLGGVNEYVVTNYNFRTDTGVELLLTDLLDGTETEIKEMVADVVLGTYPDLGNDTAETIRGYAIEDFNFYIAGGHIRIYFNPGELAIVMGGSFDVELPAKLKENW